MFKHLILKVLILSICFESYSQYLNTEAFLNNVGLLFIFSLIGAKINKTSLTIIKFWSSYLCQFYTIWWK